jgi:hypothetical protein
MRKILALLFCIIVLAACKPIQETPRIRVSLIADGRERTFAYNTPVTIDEFLRDPKVGVELGELDKVNPPQFTQINDGMQITIVRVTEKSECERSEIPYRQTTVLNEGLKPGEQKVGQAGQNGTLEVCYRITSKDGVPDEKVETNRTIIKAAQDEIIIVGPTGEIEPVAITGTLAYINKGNTWVMRGSSTSKRSLTTTGDLDNRIFSLSSNGRQLLFARKNNNGTENVKSFNQLWMIADINQNKDPVKLIPGDILYADWIPGMDNTISYSTGEASKAAPGWLAYNDLWKMRLDSVTGGSLNVTKIIERSSGGLYGWWGTRFQWSQDGKKLIWVQADAAGLVDLEKGKLNDPLLRYPVFRPVGDWSWRATVSWSPDNNLLLTTIHGPTVGRELPENSPAFNIAAAQVDGSFITDVVKNAGIWSAPKYSPLISKLTSQFPQGYIAYLQARDPFNSINGEYDLVVADRDGSNARKIFPKEGQAGLTAQQSIFQNQEFAWSPDGRQIAFLYQGNLWMIDVESAVAHQLTLDGGASNPIWTQ